MEKIKKIVYLNACDCLRYGYGFKYLNKCGLNDQEALKIWKKAKKDLGGDF